MKQSDYIIEDFGNGNKQISRFNYEGNRIVVIKVTSFNQDEEMDFIKDALNKVLAFELDRYESKDSPNNAEI